MTELPRGWADARLDDVAEVRLGRQRSPKNHSGSRMRPYLRAANVTWHGLDLQDVKEMNFTEEESAVYELRSGDVLVAEASGSADEVGKPAVWRGEIAGCCFQNTLIRVRTLGPLPQYLRYFLLAEAQSGRIGRASPGVGIHHIGAARLAAWPVPVAPLAEQKRIVNAIEEQLSRLEAADKSLVRAIAKLRPLKNAILTEALDRDWEHVPVGDVVSIDSGPAFKSKYFGGPEGGVRLLRGENIEPGSLRWRETKTWPESMLPGYEHLLLARGDVILAMDRPVISSGLKLARVEEDDLPALLVQRVARLRSSDEILSEFLYLTLQLPRFIPHVLGDQTGTQLPHITLAGIRAFEIPLPPVDVQAQLVEEVTERLGRAERLVNAARVGKRRSQTLRRALLASAFRGELASRDPRDEPARELLERIAAERATAKPTQKRRAKAPART